MNDRNVTEIIRKYGKKNGNSLIGTLQFVQGKYRYLSEDNIRAVSARLGLPLIDVYGVATFYNSFNLKPVGKHLITVCMGTACHVRGGVRIADAISMRLGIKPGQTTKDSKFTLHTVNCLGCCAIGPIVVIDGVYHGKMTSSRVLSLLKNIGKAEDEKTEIARRTGSSQEKNTKK